MRQGRTVIDVVLPARNEAPALRDLLASFPAGFRPVVVDNGSTDGTAAVARDGGAVVTFESRPGYGAAVVAGLRAATTDVVCVMDADGSMDPAELPGMVAVLASGADLVVGRRRPRGRGVWPWHARLANRFVAARLSRRLGVRVHDIGPVRVFRRQAMLDLDVQDRRFGYPLETLVRAARAGWCIVEVDISYRRRALGTRSKVTGSLSGSIKAARDFARVMP
jgi:glycosyltransferase involved in cell wall biosynthesis